MPTTLGAQTFGTDPLSSDPSFGYSMFTSGNGSGGAGASNAPNAFTSAPSTQGTNLYAGGSNTSTPNYFGQPTDGFSNNFANSAPATSLSGGQPNTGAPTTAPSATNMLGQTPGQMFTNNFGFNPNTTPNTTNFQGTPYQVPNLDDLEMQQLSYNNNPYLLTPAYLATQAAADQSANPLITPSNWTSMTNSQKLALQYAGMYPDSVGNLSVPQLMQKYAGQNSGLNASANQMLSNPAVQAAYNKFTNTPGTWASAAGAAPSPVIQNGSQVNPLMANNNFGSVPGAPQSSTSPINIYGNNALGSQYTGTQLSQLFQSLLGGGGGNGLSWNTVTSPLGYTQYQPQNSLQNINSVLPLLMMLSGGQFGGTGINPAYQGLAGLLAGL